MSGLMDPAGGMAIWFLLTTLMWIVPLILMIWFVRTLTAMVAAQRDIAEQLRLIVLQGHRSPSERLE